MLGILIFEDGYRKEMPINCNAAYRIPNVFTCFGTFDVALQIKKILSK